MAQLQRLEGQIEVKCSAQKMFDFNMSRQPDVAILCSSKVRNIEANQDDWMSVGSTRKWDFVIDGKRQHMTDKIEAFDVKKMTINRSVIDGEIMKQYKTMKFKVELTPTTNEDDSCQLKFTLDYEKMHEYVPEPQNLLDFVIDLCKDLAGHLSTP